MWSDSYGSSHVLVTNSPKLPEDIHALRRFFRYSCIFGVWPYITDTLVELSVPWLFITGPHFFKVRDTGDWFHDQREPWGMENSKTLSRAAKRDKQGHKYCGGKCAYFSGFDSQCFLGTVISGKVKWGRLDCRSSLRQGYTAVSDRLPPIIFLRGGKGRNGVPKHLFRHAQQEEGLGGGRLGRGDNEAASLQPPLGYGPVYLLNYCAGASLEMCSPDDSW